MKTHSVEQILQYIKEKKQATPHELVDFLGISKQALFRHLKKLVFTGELVKIGQAPKVFYLLPADGYRVFREQVALSRTTQLSLDQQAILEDRYMYISPLGVRHDGIDGFMHWCAKTQQPVAKTAGEYIITLQKYDCLKKDGLLDGKQKLRSSFETVYLDELFYLDFYSIERFGKTKLGQLLLYAKQNQNRELIKQLAASVKLQIEKLITRFAVDAVGFIPPTVKREVQFMVEFAKQLGLAVPVISTTKVTSDVSVPQKTLSKIEDRIENARRTIIVTERKQYKNILLIDDAVGSGATLNETANKLKEQKVATGKVIGLAITGSYKGFDVISEI